MQTDFAGKTAVVTGASSGIGRAVPLDAAHAGMHVAIADIDGAAAASVADEMRVADNGVSCKVSP